MIGGRLRLRMRPRSFDVRRDEFRDIVHRSRDAVLLAAITGVIVGLGVRGFEYLVIEVAFHWVVNTNIWMMAGLPVVGLLVSSLILKYLGRGASSATTDEYLRAFHDRHHLLHIRPMIARLSASVVTLGSGGALGLEGPSLYGGATIGHSLQRRFPRLFRRSDHRTLLVAGAAAGVAAIFKAPATGAIFALEVPYRDDLARRMLLPALVASATGYFTFVSLSDTSPIFRVVDVPLFSLRDLVGALIIGVVAALGARVFAKMMKAAKAFSTRAIAIRVSLAGSGLVLLFWLSWVLTGQYLTNGTGYEVITGWLIDPDLALWVIVAIFLMRCLSSAFTMAGGGVGGVFIPLVVGGAFTGRIVGEVVHPERYTLYTLLGIAAFLGAGYRVPLAAVMFVAETTGRPNFVVPALFAAVAAELVMGEQSITVFQRRPYERLDTDI
jgi:CIC family chloride channel protein